MTTNTGQPDWRPIISRVPHWAGRDDIHSSLLSGGITNHNVRVDVGGRSFVLRLAGEKTELLGIDRRQEYAAHAAAAAIGVAPGIFYLIEPEGYLVTRFVDGRPLTVAEVGQPDTIARIAGILQRVHALPPIAATFSAFETVRTYTRTAGRHGAHFPEQFDRWLARMAEIEAAVAPQVSEPAFCHNDLLNANFLQEGDRIYLLDWEYAGMGDPFFDLANLAAHHEFDEQQERLLLTHYLGHATPADHARLKLMKIMSDFREGMWGLVQTVISELDFDFAGYAQQHFERMAGRMAHPHYQQWLEESGD